MSKTIADRFKELGFGSPGNEIDVTIHRVLDEIEALRKLAGSLGITAPSEPPQGCIDP